MVESTATAWVSITFVCFASHLAQSSHGGEENLWTEKVARAVFLLLLSLLNALYIRATLYVNEDNNRKDISAKCLLLRAILLLSRLWPCFVAFFLSPETTASGNKMCLTMSALEEFRSRFAL
jgi:hypothetical protein